MMRRGAMRWAAALILGAALANPAWATPEGKEAREPASLSRLWEAAAAWFAASWQTLAAEATSDRGPAMDPDGSTAGSDHGSMIDPNG